MSDTTERKLVKWIIIIVTTVNMALMSFIAIQTDKYYSLALDINVKQARQENDINNLKSDVEKIKEVIK